MLHASDGYEAWENRVKHVFIVYIKREVNIDSKSTDAKLTSVCLLRFVRHTFAALLQLKIALSFCTKL